MSSLGALVSFLRILVSIFGILVSKKKWVCVALGARGGPAAGPTEDQENSLGFA